MIFSGYYRDFSALRVVVVVVMIAVGAVVEFVDETDREVAGVFLLGVFRQVVHVSAQTLHRVLVVVRVLHHNVCSCNQSNLLGTVELCFLL